MAENDEYFGNQGDKPQEIPILSLYALITF